jgi:hypothetical protein
VNYVPTPFVKVIQNFMEPNSFESGFRLPRAKTSMFYDRKEQWNKWRRTSKKQTATSQATRLLPISIPPLSTLEPLSSAGP